MNTRSKAMEDQIKKLENNITNFRLEFTTQLQEIWIRMDQYFFENNRKMKELRELLVTYPSDDKKDKRILAAAPNVPTEATMSPTATASTTRIRIIAKFEPLQMGNKVRNGSVEDGKRILGALPRAPIEPPYNGIATIDRNPYSKMRLDFPEFNPLLVPVTLGAVGVRLSLKECTMLPGSLKKRSCTILSWNEVQWLRSSWQLSTR